MRKIILSLFLLLVFFGNSIVSSVGQVTEPVPQKGKIKILYDGKLLSFANEPIMLNGRVLVPLRQLAEQMGANVEWNSESWSTLITKNEYEARLWLESDTVFTSKRQIFYMDQVPMLVNNCTFIPIRSINPILGTNTEWDEKNNTVTITSDSYNNSISSTDKYYKLYDILIGSSSGPSIEEARQYVLENGLLTEVEYTRFVNPGFSAGYDTAVSGYNLEGRYKVIWLTVHTYWETIEVAGEAFLDEGIPEDRIKDILKEEGFQLEEIRDIYLAKFSYNESVPFAWHAVANHDGRTTYYWFDFKTGKLVPDTLYENPFYTIP